MTVLDTKKTYSGCQMPIEANAPDGLVYSGSILGRAAVKCHVTISNHGRGAHESI